MVALVAAASVVRNAGNGRLVSMCSGQRCGMCGWPIVLESFRTVHLAGVPVFDRLNAVSGVVAFRSPSLRLNRE